MEELKAKFKKIIEDLGYYLYDVTYELEGEDFILRVLIENDTFIDIDDCVKVSRVISDELDILDPFDEAYNLEVASSGAERELRNTEEVQRAVGKTVYVETLEQTFQGKLKTFQNDILEIVQKNKKVTKVNYIDVSYIRLTIIF
ncbi:MAG: ribosome maturation factor RimP [Bacilli bacterium]|nr:ribosome maturation factor RimP [Bacilli bacterium]